MPTRAPSQTASPAQQNRWFQLPVFLPAAALVCFALLLAGCSSGQASQISFSNASDWRADLVVAPPATGGALDLPVLVDSLQEQRLSPELTAEVDKGGSQSQVLELAGSGGPDQVRRLIYGELNRVLSPLQADTAITLAGSVHAGQALTFSFESNPSTGYTWQPVSYDPGLLQPLGRSHVRGARGEHRRAGQADHAVHRAARRRRLDPLGLPAWMGSRRGGRRAQPDRPRS